ncbi:hypothetical protein RRG08_037036 [Elysia crispata]|uniref:Uncharacterized protein n=1 Tax=Elysia crispata TaxID=231223 RepID=A0AAE1CVQ1_9GAST|nr:hypothetical protein RRG08_037036 [Elysia crispata]
MVGLRSLLSVLTLRGLSPSVIHLFKFTLFSTAGGVTAGPQTWRRQCCKRDSVSGRSIHACVLRVGYMTSEYGGTLNLQHDACVLRVGYMTSEYGGMLNLQHEACVLRAGYMTREYGGTDLDSLDASISDSELRVEWIVTYSTVVRFCSNLFIVAMEIRL